MGNEAVKRYLKLQKFESNFDPSTKNSQLGVKVEEIRKTRGGVILDPDDILKNVLDDNEFVNIGIYMF